MNLLASLPLLAVLLLVPSIADAQVVSPNEAARRYHQHGTSLYPRPILSPARMTLRHRRSMRLSRAGVTLVFAPLTSMVVSPLVMTAVVRRDDDPPEEDFRVLLAPIWSAIVGSPLIFIGMILATSGRVMRKIDGRRVVIAATANGFQLVF